MFGLGHILQAVVQGCRTKLAPGLLSLRLDAVRVVHETCRFATKSTGVGHVYGKKKRCARGEPIGMGAW